MITVGMGHQMWYSWHTVIAVLPYTGRYTQWYNCVLRVTSDTPRGYRETAYFDPDRQAILDALDSIADQGKEIIVNGFGGGPHRVEFIRVRRGSGMPTVVYRGYGNEFCYVEDVLEILE